MKNTEKFLPHDNLPAWYEVDIDCTALVLRIHPAKYGLIVKDCTDEHLGLSDQMTKRLDLQSKSFIQPTQKCWGFGPVIKRLPDDTRGWICLRCQLPKTTGEQYDWNELYAISGTLEIIFDILRFNGEHDKITNSTNQLLTVSLSTQCQTYGGIICASLSPTFVSWLARAQTNDVLAAEKTMFTIGTRLFGKFYGARAREFHIEIDQGWRLSLNVPGDACDLSTDGGEIFEANCGHNLEPHNTDSPMQQLTLLAGLAKLTQLARQDGA